MIEYHIEGQDDMHFRGLSLGRFWKGCAYIYRDFWVKLFESLIGVPDSYQHSVTIQIEVNVGLRGVLRMAVNG